MPYLSNNTKPPISFGSGSSVHDQQCPPIDNFISVKLTPTNFIIFWDALEISFGKSSQFRLFQVQMKFHSLKRGSMTVSTYISPARETVIRWASHDRTPNPTCDVQPYIVPTSAQNVFKGHHLILVLIILILIIEKSMMQQGQNHMSRTMKSLPLTPDPPIISHLTHRWSSTPNPTLVRTSSIREWIQNPSKLYLIIFSFTFSSINTYVPVPLHPKINPNRPKFEQFDRMNTKYAVTKRKNKKKQSLKL